MPVHLKIPICTFIFSHNPLLTLQDDSQGQYVCLPKFWFEFDHKRGRYGKKSISPILLLLVVVVVVVLLQVESQYLKNRKRYRSEILYTSRV